MANTFDMLDAIIAFEEGTADGEQVLELFGHLISTGTAWTLQGTYGRTAARLIDAGIIDADGNVDWDEAFAQGVTS